LDEAIVQYGAQIQPYLEQYKEENRTKKKWHNTRADKETRYAHYYVHKTTNIAEKERWSIELIKLGLQRSSNPSLSCSFGIDSMVILYLTRKALVELGRDPSDIDVAWNDTANEFADVRKYQKFITAEWNLRLTISKPEKTLKHIITDNGGVTDDYFFSRKGDRSQNKQPLGEKCCGTLKHKPMKKMIKENKWDLITVGLRADESTARFQAGLRDGEFFYSVAEWKALVVRPILWWTENDIWDYVEQEGIPYNELYDKNQIQAYPDNLEEILDVHGSTLESLGADIEGLREKRLTTVSRKVALYLKKKCKFQVFPPRTGCMMCPIPVKYGYMSWMRQYYPKVYDAMVYNLGYGDVLLNMIPDDVRNEIEKFLGITITPENAHEYLQEILEFKPCTLDNF
jgi:3'-phosphoadenosine 5'-phosphosulfate sulfotransferase (PAPS reductase)/FAD synthetase